MSFLQAYATVLPKQKLTREQVLDLGRRALKGRVPFFKEALGLFERAGVGERYLVEPIDKILSDWDFKSRNQAFLQHAVDLGAQLMEALFDQSGTAPQQIDMLITTSCTGFAIPAFDAHLINRFRLRSDIKRLPLTELGCAAGAMALARAHDYLRAYPDHRVMILALEFPSLTFRPEDFRIANLVSAALFGDGGAGVILGGHEGPCRFLDSRTVFFYESLHQMGFELDEKGFRIILDKGVPELIRREFIPEATAFLEQHNLTRADLSTFVFHPGGRKILDVLADTLDLGDEDLAVSRQVLNQVGNLSSASVLYVLAETLRQKRARGNGLLAAFGPGFNAELLLAQFY